MPSGAARTAGTRRGGGVGTYADAGAAMGGKLHGAVILPSGRRHAVAHPYGANPDAEQRRIAEFDRGGMR